MRKWIVSAVVGVLALALAGVALAAFTQYSTISFTTTHPGKSTGIKANVYGKIGSGQQTNAYRAAKLVTITFPAGTKFNPGSVKACTLSDRQLQSGKACPASSKIGTGSATVVAPPLPTTIKANVVSYASGKSSMLIVATAVVPGLSKQTVVIHETYKGTTLKIPVPASKVSGFNVVLTGLKLNVPARGSGTKALLTAGKCTGGKFVFKSHFVYRTGPPANVTSTSNCK
jgi:hypothetical protein